MVESIDIDFLNINDLEGLVFLYENGFGSSKSNFENVLRTFDKIKNDGNYNIFCARINGVVAGSVMGVACYELFGECLPFMVVENVVVLEKYRRIGIAKQLMIRLEERARELKCSMIVFVSSEHRSGAHKLYESLNYGADKVNGYRKRLSYE